MIGHNISTSLAFKYYNIKIYSNLISFSKAIFLALVIVFYDVACSPLHYLQAFMRYIWQIQCCEEVLHSLGSYKGINHSYQELFLFFDKWGFETFKSKH